MELTIISPRQIIGKKSLKEAFELFGFHDGDIVETRDLVIMHTGVQDALKRAKQDFEASKEYDAAITVRNRLEQFKQEFIQMKESEMNTMKAYQHVAFEQAARKCKQLDATERKMSENQVTAFSNERRRSLLKSHDIQDERLEEFIQNMRVPPFRHSKHLLEQVHSEKHLRKMDKFEEAQSLNKRILKLEPREKQAHDEAHERTLEQMRLGLRQRQQFELEKLREKMHSFSLSHDNACDLKKTLTDRKLSFHKESMKSKHNTEGKVVEAYCAVHGGKVRPVVEKRKSYKKTSAMFRGTQLLDSVQGNAIKNVASLCEIHDFNLTPKYTHDY